MDLAQSLNVAMVQAAIESVPRTIIPVSPRNEVPITTEPAVVVDKPVVKKEVRRVETKKVKTTKTVAKEDKMFEKSDESPPQLSEKVYEFDGVHLDLYDYFDLSPANVRKDEISKLQKVQEWSEGNTAKIDKVRRSLGKSKVGYEGLVDLYNYIRVRELR